MNFDICVVDRLWTQTLADPTKAPTLARRDQPTQAAVVVRRQVARGDQGGDVTNLGKSTVDRVTPGMTPQ